jgi:hypothetical protein
MANSTKKHLSQEDKKYWDELYEYVRRNVMNYDENQSLSRAMVLRLKGLLNNKFMANNNIVDTANYSYQVVLNTFKFCYPSIQKGLQGNTFRDENNKFNYILKIVESNLNTVYTRMKNAEKAKEEAETADVSVFAYSGAEYKPKTQTNTKDKFADMW